VDGKDAIDGTFVMGRNVFLETFLLPSYCPSIRPRTFAMASPLVSSRTSGYDVEHRTVFVMTANIRALRMIHSSFPMLMTTATRIKPNRYRWTKTQRAGSVFDYNKDSEHGDLRAGTRGQRQQVVPIQKQNICIHYRGADEMAVDVTWVPDTPNISLQIKPSARKTASEIRPFSLRGAGTIFECESGKLAVRNLFNLLYSSSSTAHISDKYIVTWDLTLELSSTTDKSGKGILNVNVHEG